MKTQITGDGSLTLFCPNYQQTYHSRHGAKTEAITVFLQASGVAARLSASQPTSVLELGFGLGLNFLLTADLAVSNHCPLTYTAYENNLVTASQFRQLRYGSLLENVQLAGFLTQVFDDQGQTGSRRRYRSGICELILECSDIASEAFGPATDDEQVDPSVQGYDAIYLDAFSPDTNPECWTPALFKRLRGCLKPDGILTSYSVKGEVRRALQRAGFQTRKLPGPPGKREILQARIA